MNLKKTFLLIMVQLDLWAASLLVPMAIGRESVWISMILTGLSAGVFILWFLHFYLHMEKPYTLKGKKTGVWGGLSMLFLLGYWVFGLWMVTVYTSWEMMMGGILAAAMGASSIAAFRLASHYLSKKYQFFLLLLPGVAITAYGVWQSAQVAAEFGDASSYFWANATILPGTFLASIAMGLAVSTQIPSTSQARQPQQPPKENESQAQLMELNPFQYPTIILDRVKEARIAKEIQIWPRLKAIQKGLPPLLFRWPDWKVNPVLALKSEVSATLQEIQDRNYLFQGPDKHPWCTQCGKLGRLNWGRLTGMVICPDCNSDSHLHNFWPEVAGIVGPSNFERGEVNIWDNTNQQYRPLETHSIRLRDTEGVNLDWFVSAFCAHRNNHQVSSFTPLVRIVVERGCSLSENSIRSLTALEPKLKIIQEP